MSPDPNVVDLNKFAKSGTAGSEGAVLRGAGGGGDGGGYGEVPIRDWVEAKLGEARAQSDAQFDKIMFRLDHIPTTWQMIGIAAATLATAFAILAYASDRFDGGLAASSLIEPIIAAQEARNAEQDLKLDSIIASLEQLRAESQVTPEGE